MEVIKVSNLALRFILEVCSLAMLGYWGFRTGNGWIVKIVLGIGAPVLAAIVWGLFVSPKATYDVGHFFVGKENFPDLNIYLPDTPDQHSFGMLCMGVESDDVTGT